MRTIAFLPPRLAYSIDDLLDSLPFGRSALYADIGAGRLKVRKRGRRTIVLPRDLADYLENLPTYPANGAAQRKDD